jgi:putative PIN family toxin of toxin-antitoxin system
VLISSLAGGWFPLMLAAIEDGRLEPVMSVALLEELADAVARPRMRKWFEVGDADDFTDALRAKSRLCEPVNEITACRDPDDNYLLALAETAGADHLVSRDEDLLVLGHWRDTAIIPPSRFLQVLSAA